MHDGASVRGLGCGVKMTQCNPGNADWSASAVEETAKVNGNAQN